LAFITYLIGVVKQKNQLKQIKNDSPKNKLTCAERDKKK